jgi:hypothetical protein
MSFSYFFIGCGILLHFICFKQGGQPNSKQIFTMSLITYDMIQFPTLVTAVIFDSCSGYGADGILSPPTILEFQILLISFQISFEIECHM